MFENPGSMFRFCFLFSVLIGNVLADDHKTLRVFIFAGQSNMVGSDSKVADIQRFPPFVGLEKPQKGVRFSYSIGRENKMNSEGWVDLQAVSKVVGPELSFARKVTERIEAPIAIIKVAAGGTHLGGDWNPKDPIGFKMYPLALEVVRKSLAELDRNKVPYRLEGFMWHQGENDMFNEEYQTNYGANLKKFLASWRRDLKSPGLKFYIGELCTKTIWGMDLRPRMYAISIGQRDVTNTDPLAEYVPTSHVGVEIGGGVGLHYHYGTLGQLQHGENYAEAYLDSIGKKKEVERTFKKWPYKKGAKVNLFVMAGHRNMEGERAFVQDLPEDLRKDDPSIAYRYSLGGGYRVSDQWEPLGAVGYYETFGPELSFARELKKKVSGNIAIAKFTHSGSQMNDWTPEGSEAKSRNLYPRFVDFIRTSVKELKDKGHQVELAGIFYHVGENDMSMPPYRKKSPEWLKLTVEQVRQDLKRPKLKWIVSQQAPTDDKRVNEIEVMSKFESLAASDYNMVHLKALNFPEQEKKLVLDSAGVIRLGEILAEGYLKSVSRKKAFLVPEGTKVIKNLVYSEPKGSPQLLDLYLPKQVASPLPVIVWVHGGGWKNGSKENPRHAAWLAAKGFAVASINYRLTSEAQWPAQIDDCRASVRWLRRNAQKYGLDADHIGAFGSSAGGHLVALMGTRPYADEASRVQAVCDWFGPSELLTMPPNMVANGRTEEQVAKSNGAILLGATVKDVPKLAKEASALDNVSADDAPFLIMHGSEDSGVPIDQSRKLHAALLGAEVPSEFHIVKEAGHGGPLFATPEVRAKVEAFFRRTLIK